MKESIKLFIKGMLIGVASILPGISGGVLAVTLGIYEKIIHIASNFFKNIRKNLTFLLPIILGAGIAIVLVSGILSTALEKYNTQTTLLFLGLLLGGIPALIQKVKKNSFKANNIFVFIVTFTIVMAFILLHGDEKTVTFNMVDFTQYIKLFLVGIVAAATLVIPGISGSLILMILGYYQPILNTISSLLKFKDLGNSLLILIPFGIGVLLGILGIAKLINFLLKKYPNQTYYAIFGIVLASIVGVIIPLIGSNLVSIVIGLLLMVGGILVSLRLGK